MILHVTGLTSVLNLLMGNGWLARLYAETKSKGKSLLRTQKRLWNKIDVI